jgi:hypothetical protein
VLLLIIQTKIIVLRIFAALEITLRLVRYKAELIIRTNSHMKRSEQVGDEKTNIVTG